MSETRQLTPVAPPKPAARTVVWMVTGAAAVAGVLAVRGVSVTGAVFAVLTALLVTAAGVDAAEYRIPNVLVAAVVALWLVDAAASVVRGAAFGPVLGQSALGALAAAGPVALLTAIAGAAGRDGFGAGDIKLLAAVGLFFPWRANLLGLAVACGAGAAIGVALRVRRGERRLPFGCGIAAGWWLVMMVGW